MFCFFFLNKNGGYDNHGVACEARLTLFKSQPNIHHTVYTVEYAALNRNKRKLNAGQWFPRAPPFLFINLYATVSISSCSILGLLSTNLLMLLLLLLFSNEQPFSDRWIHQKEKKKIEKKYNFYIGTFKKRSAYSISIPYDLLSDEMSVFWVILGLLTSRRQ